MSDTVYEILVADFHALGRAASLEKLMGESDFVLGRLLRRTNALDMLEALQHPQIIKFEMQDLIILSLIDLMRLKPGDHSSKEFAVNILLGENQLDQSSKEFAANIFLDILGVSDE